MPHRVRRDDVSTREGPTARQRDVDTVLRDITGLAMVRAQHPEQAVARGAGRILEELDLMDKLAS